MSHIKDVWADTLDEDVAQMRALLKEYPCVSMDTEFPGVVARPMGKFNGMSDYNYQTLRVNVDLLRMIQLGITLSNDRGELPPGVCTWQINFTFSLDSDMFAPDSIELLSKSGIDFARHRDYGVDPDVFAELLISSGFVLFDRVQWISFHSGYDFGYLLKMCTCVPLPPTEHEFFERLQTWFPCIWDIKYLMKSCRSLKGGLQEVADDLHVPRVGQQHQAGSDAMLTAATFFKMRSKFFDDAIDPKLMGILFGLNSAPSQPDVAAPHANAPSLLQSESSSSFASSLAYPNVVPAQPSPISLAPKPKLPSASANAQPFVSASASASASAPSASAPTYLQQQASAIKLSTPTGVPILGSTNNFFRQYR